MKYRNAAIKYGQKISYVAAGTLGVVASSFAALPAVITGAATTIQTNLQDMFDLFLPVIVLGVVLSLLPRLMKRYSKASV